MWVQSGQGEQRNCKYFKWALNPFSVCIIFVMEQHIICLLYSTVFVVNIYNFHGVHQYFKYVNSFFDTQVKVAPTLSQSCDYPQTKLHLPSVKIALSHSLSCNYPHSIYHQSKLHLPSVKVAPTLSQSCSYPQWNCTCAQSKLHLPEIWRRWGRRGGGEEEPPWSGACRKQ